jgi:hypothetical protein
MDSKPRVTFISGDKFLNQDGNKKKLRFKIWAFFIQLLPTHQKNIDQNMVIKYRENQELFSEMEAEELFQNVQSKGENAGELKNQLFKPLKLSQIKHLPRIL